MSKSRFPIKLRGGQSVNVNTYIDHDNYTLVVKVAANDGRVATKEIPLEDIASKGITDVTPYVREICKELFPEHNNRKFNEDGIDAIFRKLKSSFRERGAYIGYRFADKYTLSISVTTKDRNSEYKRRSCTKRIHPINSMSDEEFISSILEELYTKLMNSN